MAKPGYGYAHQRDRRLAIATMVDGTLCPFCHKPMYKAMSKQLDYDHSIPVAYGGIDSPKRLAHRACNRGAGARMTNRIRRFKNANGIKSNTRRNATMRRRTLPKW